MKLFDPLVALASARNQPTAIEQIETAAATSTSSTHCPVCGNPMLPCVSMGYPARFCASHNVAMPELPE